MSSYSFVNISCSMIGPGIVANLGAGAASAEEGITIEAAEDKNVMTTGADGKVMHSLVAADTATLTVRLLKTSPLNKDLMIAYDLQTTSSALHGINQFLIHDSGRGDTTIVQNAAFKKKPTITYAKEGGLMEWTFDCGAVNSILGGG